MAPDVVSSSAATAAAVISNSNGNTTHEMTEGERGRWVRIPEIYAARLNQLRMELGHRDEGETLIWLFRQAEPAVIAATGTGIFPVAVATTASQFGAIPPSSFSPRRLSTMAPLERVSVRTFPMRPPFIYGGAPGFYPIRTTPYMWPNSNHSMPPVPMNFMVNPYPQQTPMMNNFQQRPFTP